MTPREFHALVEAYELHQDLENYRAGMICAAVSNPHRKKGKKPFTPYDFFPKRKKGYTPSQEKQSWQQQLAIVKALHAAYTGEKK